MNKDAAIKIQASTSVKLPKSYSTHSTVENGNENGNGLHNTCIIPPPFMYYTMHTHTFPRCVITGNIKFDKYNFEQKAEEMTPFMLDAVSNTFKTTPIEA